MVCGGVCALFLPIYLIAFQCRDYHVVLLISCYVFFLHLYAVPIFIHIIFLFSFFGTAFNSYREVFFFYFRSPPIAVMVHSTSLALCVLLIYTIKKNKTKTNDVLMLNTTFSFRLVLEKLCRFQNGQQHKSSLIHRHIPIYAHHNHYNLFLFLLLIFRLR